MRFSVLGNCKLGLARGVALLVLGGVTAGCSSGAGRFTDGLVTASTTSNQQQIINRSEPDLVTPADGQAYAAAAPTRSQVERSSLPPVAGTTQSAAPFQRGAAPQPDAEPVRTAALNRPDAIDPLSRSVERDAETAEVAPNDPPGWSSAGGSQITAKQGETVFNLSRRYGVPADVLMKVNGLDESGALRTGQKIRIPVYVYSDRAPVSAPDNNPNVANAKSSRGVRDPAAPAAPRQTAGGGSQTAKDGIYVVEPGDSLLGIARDNGTTMAAIRTANGLEGDNLRIGQSLKIPAAGAPAAVAAVKPQPADETRTASTEPVKKKELAPEETLKPVPVAAKTTTAPVTKAVAEVEGEDDSAAPSGSGIGKMRWPAKGRVISTYGNGKDGIDIQVPEGTAVKAAENGVVIYAGNGLKDFGNTVLVRHDNGLVTVYGHASELKVKRGQKVRRGEQIATSGMTGATETPKLHFEVRKDASPVDPSTYLE